MSTDYDREKLHAEIDANLRKAYQQTLNEELPKRFLDLIDKLRLGDVAGVADSGSDQVPDQ